MLEVFQSARLSGKTIRGIARTYDQKQAIFVFTDGTFFRLEVDHDRYENTSRLFSGVLSRFRLLDFDKGDLIRLGMTTEEEYDQEQVREKTRDEEKRESRQREEYERLRKIFEPEKDEPKHN